MLYRLSVKYHATVREKIFLGIFANDTIAASPDGNVTTTKVNKFQANQDCAQVIASDMA
jgi:hypothetical protein